MHESIVEIIKTS